MEVELSQHAERQINKRELDYALVIEVARQPQQIVTQEGLPSIAQSQVQIGDKRYLIRVAFRDEGQRRVCITVYKTSKIKKYWSDK